MQISLSTDRFANKTQLDQCHSYILTQLQTRKKRVAVSGSPPPGPAITISHQTGSGAHDIAARLAGLLQVGEPKGTAPWTVFDRDLVDKMLEEHHLPQSLAEFMPEDRRSFIEDVMDELLGVIPPSWVVVQQVAETVLHLVDAGHVILVGRGANFITARMPNVFHVRLIASLPKRIERVQELNHLTPEEAAKFVKKVDRARGRYVKTHFHVGINDDLLYHLVINTDRMPSPDVAQLIVDGARMCFQSGAGGKR
jgi:cytidylate kinase